MATMGNWLKGRVLINDVSVIDDTNSHNTTTTTTRLSSTQRSNQHGPNGDYADVTSSQQTLSLTSHQRPNQSSTSSSLLHHLSNLYLVSHISEEEQIQLAKRIGLIQHLPTGIYENGGESKNSRECVICMVEFCKGDSIRFLPCLHTYHVNCIDSWLMRSFICPSCMEPVDVALLSIF